MTYKWLRAKQADSCRRSRAMPLTGDTMLACCLSCGNSCEREAAAADVADRGDMQPSSGQSIPVHSISGSSITCLSMAR